MTTPGATPTAWIPELTFGARLALVRQRMGWNMKEAAKECGLPPQSWRAWEDHGRVPRNYIGVAMAIATRTGVDLDWLVYGDARRQKVAAEPTGRYAPKDPLAARVVAVGRGSEVKHGDGRRSNRGTEGVARSVDPRPISTRPIRAVLQVATA